MSHIEILWSPFPDRFITFGNDLRLYSIESASDEHKTYGAIQLSDATIANVIATNTDVQFVKCISCYPKAIHADADILLAAGQTSGKVQLTCFHLIPDSLSLVGKEFAPKHPRQCNCVEWNPNEHSLLSAGYDKFRNDCATLIWDVQKSSEYQTLDMNSTVQFPKPLYEIGMGEVTHSLKWFIPQNRVLVSGMNNKHLKIIDLKDPSKPKMVATKAVYGISLDPFYEHRFASFFDNNIYIWDARNFKKPLIMLEPESKAITKIEWCSTRSNLLAALTKDSYSMKLYDIQDAPIATSNTDLEPTVIGRSVNPFQNVNKYMLSSFAWHPDHDARMIIVSQNGNLRDFDVVDRITLNWSPASEIIWTHGKKILQCIDSRDRYYESFDDIAVKMRSRALEGYGLKPNKLWELFPEGSPLYNLWKWIEHANTLDINKSLYLKSLSIDSRDDIRSNSSDALFGVRSILMQNNAGSGDSSLNTRSEKFPLNSIGSETAMGASAKSPINTAYRSNERRRALELCGWDTNIDNPIANSHLIEQFESSHKWTRAAAISVFYHRIRRAIQTLRKAAELDKDNGGDHNLGSIAMALSGYSRDKSSLWREMCQSIKLHLPDAYLKAIFTFLTCDNDNYDEILFDRGLTISDRVAFACIYLSDSMLCDFLNKLHRQMIDNGDLNGILLTGITTEAIDLFTRYVEVTSDVQTISLLLLHSLPNSIYQHSHCKSWVESYRHLLDCWRLWDIRALFDNEWYKSLYHQEEPKQEIFVICNYCSHPISSYISRAERIKPQSSQQQYHRSSSSIVTNKTRIQSCPTCRKPLPRCSLCYTQLGTPSGSYWRHGLTFTDKDAKLSPFSSWFSWCQTCRHGGHANHIIDWFNEHNECPVSGCECRCMTLDSTAKMGISTTSK